MEREMERGRERERDREARRTMDRDIKIRMKLRVAVEMEREAEREVERKKKQAVERTRERTRILDRDMKEAAERSRTQDQEPYMDIVSAANGNIHGVDYIVTAGNMTPYRSGLPELPQNPDEMRPVRTSDLTSDKLEKWHREIDQAKQQIVQARRTIKVERRAGEDAYHLSPIPPAGLNEEEFGNYLARCPRNVREAVIAKRGAQMAEAARRSAPQSSQKRGRSPLFYCKDSKRSRIW